MGPYVGWLIVTLLLASVGMLLLPLRYRRVLLVPVVVVLFATVAGGISNASFTPAPSSRTPPTEPNTMATGTLTTPAMSCNWTSGTALRLQWGNTVASLSNTQLYRSANGGAYSTIPPNIASSTTTYIDNPTSSTSYQYYGVSNSGAGWVSSNSNTVTSSTCRAAIGQLVNGALSPPLSNPYGIAYDSAGDLFIADTSHNRIRMIPNSSGTYYGVTMAAGTINTIVGDGTSGTANDNGLDTTARVAGPRGVAVDQYGNVFIADTGNNAIRILWNANASSPTYNIAANYPGLTPAAPAANHVYTIWGSLGNTGDGTGAAAFGATGKLSTPQDVAVDSSGDVFTPDLGSNKVKELDAESGSTTQYNVSMSQWNAYTIAGNGTSGGTGDTGAATSAKLSNPQSVALDGSGNVYISDRGNNEIRVVAASNGQTLFGVSAGTAGNIYGVVNQSQSGCGTYSSCGDGTNFAYNNSKINTPYYIAFDSGGNLLISDQGDSRVRVLFANTTSRYGIATPTANDIYLLAGTGQTTYSGDGYTASINGAAAASAANIGAPYGIAVDPTTTGRIAVVDNGKNLVRAIDTNQDIVYTIAGRNTSTTYGNDGSPAFGWEITTPYHGAATASGNYYFADSGDNRIREWIPQANCNPTSSCPPGGIVKTIAGTGSGTSSGDGTVARDANISAPQGVAVDGSGNVVIAETGANDIRYIPAASCSIGACPYGYQAAMTAGDIYTLAGTGTACAGSCGDGATASSAKLKAPQDVAFDSHGNVIVSDTGTCEVRLLPKTGTASYYNASRTAGTIYKIAGTELSCADSSTQLNNPDGITLDANDNVYIAEVGVPGAVAGAIRKITASTDALSTAVGTGATSGCAAVANGAPGSTTLCNPADVSYDSTSGALYIADNGNALIRCWAINSGPYCGQTSASANTVYTLAGTGTHADAGDGTGAVGGQNTSPGAAAVYFPHGVDVVPGGGLYLLQFATGADVREIYGPDP